MVCCAGLNQDLSHVHRRSFFEYISKITWLVDLNPYKVVVVFFFKASKV